EADLRTHNSVEEMKQLSGKYNDIEFVKSESAKGVANHNAEHAVKLNPREWDQHVNNLAITLKGFRSPEDQEVVPLWKLSPLQEDENRYYATAVIAKRKNRLTLATVSWQKQPLGSWLASSEDQVREIMAAAGGKYKLPNVT